MRKIKDNRVKWLNIRISQKEYDLLQIWVTKTTCRKVSELARDILFRRPIGVYFRNKTADEFFPVAIQLKNELSSIGNNLNQTVKSLHSFRTDREMVVHLFSLEIDRKMILNKTGEIQQKLQDIYDLLIGVDIPRTQKSHVLPPILSGSTQAAAGCQSYGVD